MTTDNQSSNQLSSSITNLHLVAKQNLRGFLSRLPFPRWLGLPPLKQPTANYKVLQTANGIGKYQTIYSDEFAKVLHEKSEWIVTILPLFHSSKLIKKPSFGDQTWRKVVVYAIAKYLIKKTKHVPTCPEQCGICHICNIFQLFLYFDLLKISTLRQSDDLVRTWEWNMLRTNEACEWMTFWCSI